MFLWSIKAALHFQFVFEQGRVITLMKMETLKKKPNLLFIARGFKAIWSRFAKSQK